MANVGNDWVQLAYWENSTGYGSYVSQLRLIAWSSQDVANNRSTIHFKWQKSITGGSAYWADSHTYTVSFGGKSLSWSFAFGNVSSTSWVDCAGEQTMLVGHNDQGVLSGSFSCTGYKMWEYVEGSGNITCPTIPRASAPSVTPNPITLSNANNTITVKTNRKASAFTHGVTVTIGSFTQSKQSVGESTIFDIPKTVLADFAANSKTLSGTVSCTTYNGSTNIGTKSTTFTAQIDTAQEYPKIDSVVIEDTNSRTSAVTQDDSVYIANISTLKATIRFSTVGSYTRLKTYTILCGSETRTGNFPSGAQNAQIEVTFDRINVSSFDVVVVDERGESRGKKQTWTLISYQPVTAVATVGRPSATGSVGVGQVTGRAYGGNFGATQNSLTIVVDFKKNSDSDYDSQGTETYTLALTQDGYNSWTDALTFNYTLDYQYQYDIRFTVSDLFSTAVYTARMMQGLPILSWDETEVDVFGDLHIHDRDNPTVWQDVMEGFDAVMDYAGKNLLIPIPQTVTSNGVTFAVYEDGACKATGTATAETWSTYCPVILDAGDYILSGSVGDVDVELWNDSGSTLLYRSSLGEEIRFTVSSKTVFRLYARVASGRFANTRVEPMVKDARIASDKYRRPMFITRETRSSSFSLAANGNTSVNITLPSMDGYRPLAVLRTWTNGTVLLSYSNTSSLDAIRNDYVTVWVRNITSAAVSSMTASVEVLYISIGR